jgi:hypothetical protein
MPAENGLPVEWKDPGLNIILRIYAPDLKKMKPGMHYKQKKTEK